MAPEQGDVATQVKGILAEQLDLPAESIHDDSELVAQLGMDSFGMVELMFELEDETGIAIPDEDLPQIRTFGDLVAYIEGKLRDATPETVQPGQPGQ